MNLEDFNDYCGSLANTTHVVQWGDADVWKIGGKVFAIGGWNDDDEQLFVTFKCDREEFALLAELPGCRPAPYLASRGMSWIQRTGDESVHDNDLLDYLADSYRIVSLGLTKKLQRELGLNQG